MRWTVVVGVCVTWLIVAVVLGSQAALGTTMQGDPVALSGSVQTALINNLTWIPATLVAIWMAMRFPFSQGRRVRAAVVHIVAVPLVAWIANLGVVGSFWVMNGVFNGWGALAGQAVVWATVRLHTAIVVYSVSAGLTWVWQYVRETRARDLHFARLETQITKARLQALNEQIRPHFLFNTLHTIGQLWRSGRADEADEMLDHLGSLFQRVQSSTDQPAILLDDELSMVEDYLAIERSRFPDRLSVEVCASAEARSCLVPPLILQPLVENAIKHGVSTSPDAGRVVVSAEVEAGRLLMKVQDDGPGLNGQNTPTGSGTGLSNTRERLKYTFREDHAFDIASVAGGGVTVRVDVPAANEFEWPAVLGS